MLSSMIVSALGCAIIIGISGTQVSLSRTMDRYVREYNYPDAVITTNVKNKDILDDLRGADCIDKVVARLCADTTMRRHDGRYVSVRAFSWREDDFQPFYFWEKAENNTDLDELYMEVGFARDNGISDGDTEDFLIDDEYREYFISALVSMPETIVAQPSEEARISNSDFGFVYGSEELLGKEVNQDNIDAKEELSQRKQDLNDAEKDAEEERKKSEADIEDAKSELNTKKQDFEDARPELDDKRDELNDAQKEIEDKRKELRDNRNDLIKSQEEAEKKLEEAEAQKKELDENQMGLMAQRAELDAQQEQLDAKRAEAEAAIAELEAKKTEIYAPVSEIEKSLEELNDSHAQLEAKIADKKTGEDERAELSAQLAETEQTITELEEKQKQEKDKADKLYASELEEPMTEAESGIAETEAMQQQLDESSAQLKVAEDQLAEGLAQAEAGIAQIDAVLSQTKEGWRKIEDGERELNDKSIEVNDGLVQINRELGEGEKQFSYAEIDIEDSEKKLNDTWVDARMRFADTREEIEKALRDLDSFKGYDYLCNQLLIKFKSGEDHKKSLERVESLLENISEAEIKNSFTYEDSSVKQRIDINVQPIEQMSKFMPVVFFVITLVVVFLFMSLMIKQSRREIGIIRALGFTVGKVRVIYCFINLVSSVVAVFVGIGIGEVVIRYSGSYFKAFFSLPFYEYVVEPSTMLFAAFFTIITGQIATLMGTTVIGKILPSEAMSRPAPTSSKLPEFLKRATSRLSPLGKFCVTSLLRNRVRFAFSVICISASVMMIFSSYAFITSKNQMLVEYYDKRAHYDSQIFFSEKPDRYLLNQLKLRDYISDVSELYYYSCEIEANGKSSSELLNAMSPECELITIYDEQENKLTIPEKGIILEKHLADELGVKKGDKVKVDGTELTISDISFQSISRSQFVSLEQAKELGDAKFWCVLCNIGEQDEQYLIRYLINRDEYVFNVFTRVLRQGDEKTFATYDAMAWIIISFAVIIGLVIIINTTNTNLLEQKKELCVLRTLGFQHGELSRQWFLQSLLQFVSSCVIGLLAGQYIAKIALRNLSSDTREYIYANGIREYILTAAMVFAFILASHIIAMRSLKKWDIVETVKEKE